MLWTFFLFRKYAGSKMIIPISVVLSSLTIGGRVVSENKTMGGDFMVVSARSPLIVVTRQRQATNVIKLRLLN